MRKAFIVFALLALATAASAGMAGRFGVGAHGTAFFPFGALADFYENDDFDKVGLKFGPGVGFDLAYGVSEAFTLEYTFTYYFVGESDGLKDLEDFYGFDYKLTLFDTYAGGRYAFVTEGSFAPYVGFGIGYLSFKEEAEIGGTTVSGDTYSKFGFYGGLGFDYALGESMNLNFNGKFHYVPSLVGVYDFATGDLSEEAGTFVTFSLGFMFLFGGGY